MYPSLRRSLLFAVAIGCSILLLAGCGADDSTTGESSGASASETPPPPQTMDIRSVWVRPAPSGGNSALYMTLVNGTQAADTLLNVDVAVADTVEIHESYQTEDNMSGMRPIGPLPVAPKSNVVLEPGGKHVMLLNLSEPLAADSSVAVRLTFSTAGERRVRAPIQMRPPGPK
ncbi:copper chaperone PCu(A)C [Longibacter salinarum]|nr:copper chaperone PCu(A)C [Longibacter salinarum]